MARGHKTWGEDGLRRDLIKKERANGKRKRGVAASLRKKRGKTLETGLESPWKKRPGLRRKARKLILEVIASTWSRGVRGKGGTLPRRLRTGKRGDERKLENARRRQTSGQVTLQKNISGGGKAHGKGLDNSRVEKSQTRDMHGLVTDDRNTAELEKGPGAKGRKDPQKTRNSEETKLLRESRGENRWPYYGGGKGGPEILRRERSSVGLREKKTYHQRKED